MKIFFVFTLLVSCMAMKNSKHNFFDKIINDFRDDSYFIVIKNNDKINYIVENDDLYYYLQKQNTIDKEQYKKEVKAKLINGNVFEIVNPNSNFIKVPNVPSVVANAKKGADEFNKIYFDNGKTLKDGITDDERTAIIQKLFEWEIASKIDDETGYLVISK